MVDIDGGLWSVAMSSNDLKLLQRLTRGGQHEHSAWPFGVDYRRHALRQGFLSLALPLIGVLGRAKRLKPPRMLPGVGQILPGFQAFWVFPRISDLGGLYRMFWIFLHSKIAKIFVREPAWLVTSVFFILLYAYFCVLEYYVWGLHDTLFCMTYP